MLKNYAMALSVFVVNLWMCGSVVQWLSGCVDMCRCVDV